VVKIAIGASLEGDSTCEITVSYLDLVVGVVVAWFLEEDWVAPAVDGAGFEEVFASFEFDGEFLFSSLKTVSKLVHNNNRTRG
jgi:hypothetical protein